jgi:DNA-binding transcriptional ArsR family regulator
MASEASRKDQWGRWEIIRECRVPDHYFDKKGQKRQVNPWIVKTVLLDLAQWDSSDDAEVYKGVGNIAHATQLAKRNVELALYVLKQAGIIAERKWRGMGAPKRTHLDWEKIEELRQPFSATFAKSEPVTDQSFDEELPPEPPSPVAEAMLTLKFLGDKIRRKDADRLAASLLKKHDEDELLRVLASFEGTQLAVATREAKNSAAYLKVMIENAMGAGADADVPVPEPKPAKDVAPVTQTPEKRAVAPVTQMPALDAHTQPAKATPKPQEESTESSAKDEESRRKAGDETVRRLLDDVPWGHTKQFSMEGTDSGKVAVIHAHVCRLAGSSFRVSPIKSDSKGKYIEVTRTYPSYATYAT